MRLTTKQFTSDSPQSCLNSCNPLCKFATNCSAGSEKSLTSSAQYGIPTLSALQPGRPGNRNRAMMLGSLKFNMAPCDTLDVLKSMFVAYIRTTALFLMRLHGKERSGIQINGIADVMNVSYYFVWQIRVPFFSLHMFRASIGPITTT